MGRNLAFVLLAVVGCAEPDNGGGACPALTKPRSGGTSHYTTSPVDEKTETWKASDSPHIVNFQYVMYSEITIEPCSFVAMTGDFVVARAGKLIARGTEDQPIVFDRLEPDVAWGEIELSYQSSNGEAPDEFGGFVDLAYVTLIGGGGSGSSDKSPVISSRGNDYQFEDLEPVGHILVDHVTIDGGNTVGVHLEHGSTFAAGSRDLTIKNVADAPIETSFRALGSIPVGGTYTGNGRDVIQVRPEVPQSRDITIRDVGVPYSMSEDHASDDFIVTKGATVTIEAGATLAFKKWQGLQIYDDGVLVARGTSAKPITFTSAQKVPAAGDWSGIGFRGKPRAENMIDGIVVDYAGGEDDALGRHCDPAAPLQPKTGYGAISFNTAPTAAFVKNTTIRNSLHHGVNRGWEGAPMDLSPTNTFMGIAGCKQSFPVPASGDCPAQIPCN